MKKYTSALSGLVGSSRQTETRCFVTIDVSHIQHIVVSKFCLAK